VGKGRRGSGSRGRRHAISPRSAKARVVRVAPRQSGHRRTAPVAVRVFLILRRHSSWILRRTQREIARGVMSPYTCGWRCDEEAHGGDGFAPVPALEELEGDDAIPLREHVEAHGAVGLEYSLFLQLPAAGEHAALAQERDDEVGRQHSATFVATRSLREPSLSAVRARRGASASI